MSAEKFIAEAHRLTGTRPRKATKAEQLMAEWLQTAWDNLSRGFVRAIPPKVPELDLNNPEKQL